MSFAANDSPVGDAVDEEDEALAHDRAYRERAEALAQAGGRARQELQPQAAAEETREPGRLEGRAIRGR